MLSAESDGVELFEFILTHARSLVAVHGLLREEPVVSNDADFQDVEGLTVVTY